MSSLARTAACPDWKALAAHRLERQGVEPEGWSEALEHFDSCRICRRQALAADPTLIFRRLPAATAATAANETSPAEADAMRQAVAAMRTAKRVESIERGARAGRAGRAGRGWSRWVAAAALVVTSLGVPSDHGEKAQREAREAIFSRPAMSATAMTQAAMARTASEDARLPTIDGVGLPGARVYHMNGEGMSVVMVVDESLDI